MSLGLESNIAETAKAIGNAAAAQAMGIGADAFGNTAGTVPVSQPNYAT